MKAYTLDWVPNTRYLHVRPLVEETDKALETAEDAVSDARYDFVAAVAHGRHLAQGQERTRQPSDTMIARVLSITIPCLACE